MGLLGFGGLLGCHVHWQYCQVLWGCVSLWLMFLRPSLLELFAEKFLHCGEVFWKLNTSATLKGQKQRLHKAPRITFFPKPNVLFLSWWLGWGLALTWEFTGEFSQEGKLSVISVILTQLIPAARSILSFTIFFGTGSQKQSEQQAQVYLGSRDLCPAVASKWGWARSSLLFEAELGLMTVHIRGGTI